MDFYKKKKKVLIVPSKNTFFSNYFGEKKQIPCKDTCFPQPNGSFNFFKFPTTEKYNIEWEEGNIYLLIGKHTGPNKGFGIVHILQEHHQDIKAKDKLVSYENSILVAKYVSDILSSGSKIICPLDFIDNDRPIIVQSKIGRVVLEKFICPINQEIYYSVITAFSNPNVKGHQIGSL